MDPEPMEASEAARAIREISRFDAALRQRMEGVLWIVMGLTFASIFFSYAFAVTDDVPVAILTVMWVPWTVAGFAVVWSLRKALALSGPTGEHDRGGRWLVIGAAVISFAGMGALIVAGSEAAPAFGLLALGVLALVPSLAPRMGYTPLGRRVGLLLGAIGILAAVVLLAAEGGGSWGTWVASSVCFLWVAAGAYQVLQG